MKQTVWLFGNADGSDAWDWTRTRDKALKFAKRKLRKEFLKRGYDEDEGWEIFGPSESRDPQTGNTWVYLTARRNGTMHQHFAEVHRCNVTYWEGDHVRFVDPATPDRLWDVDPISGDVSVEFFLPGVTPT